MSDAAAQEKAHLAMVAAYHDIFVTHPGGRMVLSDLLREAGMLSVAFVQGDAHHTAFNDGRRSLALHILHRLRWSEAELMAMAMQRREPAYNPISPDDGLDTGRVENDDQFTLDAGLDHMNDGIV